MNEADLGSKLKWLEIPKLKDPYLIGGFYGWSNAGNVSSDTISYLKEFLRPHRFAVLSDDEGFTNYALDRPIGHIENGIILRIEALSPEFMYWKDPEGKRDLILLLDREPQGSWSSYTQIILEIFQKFEVKRLYTIGGVQDTISHSAPVLISVVGSTPDIVTEALQSDSGIQSTNYYGPVSIHSYMIKIAMEANLEALSLWGHVPAYLQRSPKVVEKIIRVLNAALGINCPTELLQRQSVELDRKINEAISKDPSLREIIANVEDTSPESKPSPDGGKIIHLNDFLRRDPNRERET